MGTKVCGGSFVKMLVPCGIHILPDKYRPKYLVQASPQDSVEYLWCSLYICSLPFVMLAYSRDVLLWVLESVSLSCFFAIVYMVVSKCDMRWLRSQRTGFSFCLLSVSLRTMVRRKWVEGQNNVKLVLQVRPTYISWGHFEARCPDRFQFQQYFYSNRKRQSCVRCYPQTSLWRFKCEHTPTVCRESLLFVECRWRLK